MKIVTDEIEQYITARLLDFYDGLLERGQIGPPHDVIVSEDQVAKPASRYTADLAP
jgi:hypothetical protein